MFTFKKTLQPIFLVFLVLFGFSGCQVYHDTTARFNAYFLAKEKLKEAEIALFGSPENQFHEVMDVLIEIDTNRTLSQKAAFDYTIEKASLPIQFHETSKWVDDCYLLIGKSRMYQGDFGNASTTFKYINSQSTNDNSRHSALIWLMRLFLESREYNNFLYIKEVINTEEVPFTDVNTRDYHLVMAQFNLVHEVYDVAAQHLELAIPFVERRAERARLNYILGQLYDETKKYEKAYEAYAKAQKLSPTFELELYAQAGAQLAKPITSSTDEEDKERFYKRKIADENNWDYRDKLYYDWAEMKVRREKYPEAIVILNKSIQASTNNTIQKSLSYLRSGQLYYEIKKFEEAALYYDSAVQIMPNSLKIYDPVAERNQILKEFIEQLNIVKQQDKLLALSELPTHQIIEYFEKEIALEKEKIIQFQENKELNKQQNQRVTIERSNRSFSSSSKNTNWYFYNQDLLVLGKSNFLRQWGSRTLEDNWRLASKEPQNKTAGNQQVARNNQSQDGEGSSSEEDIFASVLSLDERLVQIPTTPDKVAEAKDKIEDALFKLGNIYYYKLKEQKNTLETFERLITEFKESEYAPEATYTLYLLCKKYEMCEDSTYKDYMINTFPDSFYAKVFMDPDYTKKLKESNAEVEKLYSKAFNYYKVGYYMQSEQLVNEISNSFKEHSHQDKVALLAAMLKGRTVGLNEYYTALNGFIKRYPDSKLVTQAMQLLGDKAKLPAQDQ